MTETGTGLDRKTIVTRAIAGAAWSIGLMAVLWPLRLVNARVLSHSATEIFGFWTYLNMLLAIIPSIFFFGGPRVLVYFLPKLADGSKRHFILTFGGVAMASTLAGLGLVFLFPALSELLDIKERTGLIAVFLLVSIPVETVTLVIDAALQGCMRLADAEKARSLPQAIVLVLLTGVFIAAPGFASAHYVGLLVATMGLRLAITLVWCLVLYARSFPSTAHDPSAWKWFPPGLWKYSGFLQLNQLVDFVHMQADQWIVLYCLKDPTDPSGVRSLAILGGYNLARSLARFVGVVPIALRGIVFSTLCQFQDQSQIERSRRTFRLSVLIDNLVSFPIALLMMCFAREIVGFMSGKYPPVVAQVLLLVAGMAAVTNLGGASAVYVMGRGGSRFTFIVTAIGAAAQVALTWLLLSLGGRELSVAVARTVGLMVMLVLTTGWMRRNLPRAIPGAWIVSAVVLVVTGVAVYYGEPRLLWRIGLFAVGAAVVMAANLRQMDAVIRRLVLSPWRMLRLVVEEQKDKKR